MWKKYILLKYKQRVNDRDLQTISKQTHVCIPYVFENVLLRKSQTLLGRNPQNVRHELIKVSWRAHAKWLWPATNREKAEQDRGSEIREGRFAEQRKLGMRNKEEGGLVTTQRQMLACLYKHPRCPLDPWRRRIPRWSPPPSALRFPAGFHGPSANCDVPPAMLHCARDPFSFQWQS